MESPIGRTFIEKTKFPYLGRTDQMNGLPQPPLELPCDEEFSRISLPSYEKMTHAPIPLAEAIRKRESFREYARTPLTLDELAFALWCAQGVKEVVADAATFRTVPSAGARHAFELYLLANNVSGLKQGLYRFLAIGHILAAINLEPGIAYEIREGCLGQSFVTHSGATFIWTAVTHRMNWRYGERGYRYLLLDAGHSCQNLYLAAEAIGCGVCAIAAFDDNTLNHALGIDGAEQFTLYVATLGKKK
ncbi:SagB/ThcOx family dehydrogenase [Candidatus Latescibacterota bacterium]